MVAPAGEKWLLAAAFAGQERPRMAFPRWWVTGGGVCCVYVGGWGERSDAQAARPMLGRCAPG